MIILGGWDDGGWLSRPTALLVHRVLRGRGALLREYAVAESVDDSGASRAVAVTVRSRWRRRWRVPLDGRELAATAWDLADLDAQQAGGRFVPPASGAAAGWVKEGDPDRELDRWRRRTRGPGEA